VPPVVPKIVNVQHRVRFSARSTFPTGTLLSSAMSRSPNPSFSVRSPIFAVLFNWCNSPSVVFFDNTELIIHTSYTSCKTTGSKTCTQ